MAQLVLVLNAGIQSLRVLCVGREGCLTHMDAQVVGLNAIGDWVDNIKTCPDLPVDLTPCPHHTDLCAVDDADAGDQHDESQHGEDCAANDPTQILQLPPSLMVSAVLGLCVRVADAGHHSKAANCQHQHDDK